MDSHGKGWGLPAPKTLVEGQPRGVVLGRRSSHPKIYNPRGTFFSPMNAHDEMLVDDIYDDKCPTCKRSTLLTCRFAGTRKSVVVWERECKTCKKKWVVLECALYRSCPLWQNCGPEGGN